MQTTKNCLHSTGMVKSPEWCHRSKTRTRSCDWSDDGKTCDAPLAWQNAIAPHTYVHTPHKHKPSKLSHPPLTSRFELCKPFVDCRAATMSRTDDGSSERITWLYRIDRRRKMGSVITALSLCCSEHQNLYRIPAKTTNMWRQYNIEERRKPG
jgi:hypothetical protein